MEKKVYILFFFAIAAYHIEGVINVKRIPHNMHHNVE